MNDFNEMLEAIKHKVNTNYLIKLNSLMMDAASVNEAVDAYSYLISELRSIPKQGEEEDEDIKHLKKIGLIKWIRMKN